MKDKIKEWLLSQQSEIDRLIASAGITYYNANRTQPNFVYDIQKCHHESYNLIRGKDLCYDRPGTAFSYSLWYQPRRINTFLSFFLDKLIQLEGQHIEVFDLGAGAGAIQWSLGLIYVGMKRLGFNPPKITVINIDTSPFMLNYNRTYLWPKFKESYPEVDHNFITDYEVNSWSNERNLETSNPLLAASYLFDASDNKEEIAKDFKKLVDKYKPNTILLLTSEQPDKVAFLKELKSDFENQGFNSEEVSDDKLIFAQPLKQINKLRTQLYQKLKINELRRDASWKDYSYSGLILSKPQAEITFSYNKETISELNIFNPPITVRRDVTLNKKQIQASENIDRPVVIVGPAGCGKSIVITEKIKNIVEKENYSTEVEILLTSFNKGLISKLSEWLIELLDSEKYTFKNDINNYSGKVEKSSHFIFKGSNKTNIRLLHFDMLPKKLGNVRYQGLVNHNQHFQILNEIIKKVKVQEKITNDQYDNILNSDFLFEEYHRVIYGLQVGITEGQDKYLTVQRKGRGNSPSLQRNSYRRKLAWFCLTEYAKRMHIENIQSFTLRRQYFYSKLKKEVSQELVKKYDYILVDEFQDCTEADFEIFYMLIKDPNNFTIAGDLAQSVHLGTTARIPRDERMDTRRFFRLDGSYRLPVRISEAIKGLSNALVTKFGNDEGVIDITPYKGSPPGSRPIAVYAENCNILADKIKAIFAEYRIYDLNKITILEKNWNLSNELNKRSINAETDSILSLKGLEKECVLWSTSIPLEFEKEVFEFSYTIVTRTSCILIIGLTEQTQNIYKKVLGMLDKERIIMWDKETEIKFETFCEEYEQQTIIDED